jgi:L-alanine-DL-glutamate epimerase-like enolase superfamily enzyme
MKITGYNVNSVKIPADKPLVEGVKSSDTKRGFVTLELYTDQGISGVGVSFIPGNVNNPLFPSLRIAVENLSQLLIDEDPMMIENICSKLTSAATGSGPGGILNIAMAAIDTALWDIKGKYLNQSVSSLLGGYRTSINTYASGQLGRERNLEDLEFIAPRLVELGFHQMKTQMGGESTASAEIDRMRVLRQVLSPDIDLMCDINQLWNVNQAIQIGSRVEGYNLFWLEDVVASEDYQGLARVADALTTPICAGEYVYGIRPFRQMIEARSIDIVMIDLMRVGGITQFMKVAHMAEAFNLPVVSHLIPEVQVHTMAAIPNGLTVEYMPWSLMLFEETPEIKNGEIRVPTKPGLGLEFDQSIISKYKD